MLKVIRLNKKEYNGKKYNNLYIINKELAITEKMFTINNIPSLRKFRKHIVKVTNKSLHQRNNACSCFTVSIRDIKRLECPKKCEIPVNIIDILEILIDEIVKYKNNISHRATDEENAIISYYLLTNTIDLLNAFKAWLDAHEIGVRPECDKYRSEVSYVSKRLNEFNDLHPELFNDLF